MEKKVVLAIMLTLLLVISMLTLIYNIQPVKASRTIYIREDGSVDPPTAPIQRNGDIYTFTGNIYDEIVIERDNIVVDGAGHTVQGTRALQSVGIRLSGRSRVTIKSMEIKAFTYGIFLYQSSSNIVISGNNITDNSSGIRLDDSSSNVISGNTVTSDSSGIYLRESSNNIIFGNYITQKHAPYGTSGIGLADSRYNIISGNIITKYMDCIRLYDSSNNTVSGNSIANASDGGIRIRYETSNNKIYHNNFIDKGVIFEQYTHACNFWDDGYPSGGNYWSNYEKEYPNATEIDGSGIWDTPYNVCGACNIDHYPLMSPLTPSPPEHELAASIWVPASLQLGISLPLNATVTNHGSSDETNVELGLLINGNVVDSTTIPFLQSGDSHTLSYLWTPTVEGTYNVTAYVLPLPEEESKVNNQNNKFITVWPVGIKAGDWIKYGYTYEVSPETPYTEWVEVEFLDVKGAAVTMCGVIHLSNGTEQNETFTVDIADDYAWMYAPVFDTLTGFVMLANSTVGDMARIGGTDGKPCARISTIRPAHCFGAEIDGETERSYVGTSRTVVYAKYSTYAIEYGPLTCYWDKQTGVLVEVCNTRSDGWTAKAAETNIWQAQQFGLPIDPTIFYALIIVAVAMLVAVAFFIIRRRKKRPEVIEPPKS